MRTRTILIACFVASMLPVVQAAKIEVGHDPDIDFSKYSTYKWVEGAEAAKPEVERWITRAIERELRDAGFKKLKDTYADLHVKSVVLTMVNMGQFSNYINSTSGGWSFWQTNTRAYGEGALIVDLIDADTGEVVWRSIATATVTGSWKKGEKKIPKITGKMFADFPPYFTAN